jgi:hypothetical protein
MVTPASPVDWKDLVESQALPSPEDRLVASQEDWWNNACINWCQDGWGLYTAGYKTAADLLVQRIEQQTANPDSLVYPVLFLYRQYLELQIKDLIRQGFQLQGVSGDFPKHHRIGSLWEICHKLLSDLFPGDSVTELKEITRLISEFSAVDPTSMAFRYPQDKDGNPMLTGFDQINLRNVRDVIGKIALILSGAGALLDERVSFVRDMEREFRG